MLLSNWVDVVILITLLIFAIEAVGKSLVAEILDLCSFLFAFFLSFTLYNFPAKYFENEFKLAHGLSLVLGFMSVWFLSEVLFYVLVRILIPKLPSLNFKFSKVVSIVPSSLKGLIFIALSLVMIATFPIQPAIKKSVLDSRLGSQILKASYALEQPVKQVFGSVTSDSLTFLTIKPKTDQKVNLGFQTTNFSIDEATEKQMIDLVNKERTSRGIKALVFEIRLREIARLHSADMFRRGYFSHYSPEGKTVADRALAYGIDFLVIGENLAYAPSLESAHKGLMNSQGHKANILSTDYHKIGVGVMDGGVYEEMFTQVFSN